jgi:predicted transcriptional regulator of viral defense system
MTQTKPIKPNTKSAFQQNGGIMRTSEILKLGIHPRTLYQMRESGELVELSRGVYRLAELPELENSDLVAVSKRVPNGVICLVSALSFHNLTTEIPHEVYLAIPQGKEKPNIDYPPTRVFNFSTDSFENGIEEHNFDGNLIKVYSREKTIADCFKFRNKIGLDVAIEGLKRCLANKGSRTKILEFARICRVEKIIRPYLEAI